MGSKKKRAVGISGYGVVCAIVLLAMLASIAKMTAEPGGSYIEYIEDNRKQGGG